MYNNLIYYLFLTFAVLIKSDLKRQRAGTYEVEVSFNFFIFLYQHSLPFIFRSA